jgi:hypothetical protein
MMATYEKIKAVELQISILERNADNYIGGFKAYISGYKTYLKPAAERKLATLNKKLNTLYNDISEEIA